MKQLLVSLVVALVAVVAFVGVLAGPASAGGWAVSTLDSVPEPTANQTVEIGFTIRQHGVRPVDPEGEVGIVLVSADGEERFFAAEPRGETGHHVAEVTFPSGGTWTWAVRQGWFAEQPLGTITPSAPDASTTATADGGEYRGPDWLRVGLPALALALGAVALADAGSGRRRLSAA